MPRSTRADVVSSLAVAVRAIGLAAAAGITRQGRP
jgi:hypothetical protein